jgi:PAS domain S-box-containing protein
MEKESLETKLEKYLQFSDDIIFSMNRSKIIKNVNKKSLFKFLGYQSEDLIGFSFLSILHHDDFDKFENKVQLKSKNNENSIEIRIKTKDGHWHQFDCKIFEIFQNSTNDLVCVLTNIEQRKWVELKYKNLFENSPNAILIIDFKGIIVDANISTQKVFGYEKEFFIGKSLEEIEILFPNEFKSFYKETFKASFMKDFPKPIEIQVLNKSKNKIWLEIQASIIKHEKNIFLQLLFQNINEKKKRELLELEFKEKLEREVEKRTIDLNFAFQQQQKYLDQILKTSQFKTEFMSTMSHELRTPLNAIIGFTDLLLEEVYGPLTEEQNNFINDIKISAEDQFDMIKNILNISKVESGQIMLNLKRFSLNSMVEQTISSLKPLVGKKKIDFQVKGLEKEIMIEADPIKFKEILINLLSNAVKFTIEGTIIFRVSEKFDSWEFEVSDPGIGIDTKDYPIIFKDFKRVDSTYVRSVPGTGLGLSLTKRLVELHGGEINFYSALGVGTTFCFSIMKKVK